MPTPFYHLSLAQEILNHPALSVDNRNRLQEEKPAFFLGNVAPDVQTISGQTRTATHFFDLPLRKNHELPWKLIPKQYPQIKDVHRLPPSQAAFLAGYRFHLLADWLWINQVFIPVFGLRAGWGNFETRLYLHNVLRSYLDERILPTLANGVAVHMQLAKPDHWVPFIEDHHLVTWRDKLADQLQPGGKISTVEIFAARQGFPVESFHRLLASEEDMQEQIFSHLSQDQLDDYRIDLLDHAVCLLQQDLSSAE